MEWKPGQILRIRNYKFEDDGSTRDKYAIVLCTNEKEAFLIHSLTTSQNNLAVPGMQHGCSVYKTVPYYFFPKEKVIGDQQFFFSSDTFIFFRNNVRKELFSKFEAAEKILCGVVCLGILSTEELKRIIKCALKSRFLPADVEKELLLFKDKN